MKLRSLKLEDTIPMTWTVQEAGIPEVCKWNKVWCTNGSDIGQIEKTERKTFKESNFFFYHLTEKYTLYTNSNIKQQGKVICIYFQLQ